MKNSNGWKGGPDSGKAWEADFAKSLNDVPDLEHHSSNGGPAVNDRRFTWRGISGLAELKKTSSDRILFGVVNPKQSKHLATHHRAGGLSFVAIKRTFVNSSRCWLVRWADWQALKGEVRSVLLEDGVRSELLWECGRIGKQWDFVPFLEAWFHDVFVPSIELERMPR